MTKASKPFRAGLLFCAMLFAWAIQPAPLAAEETKLGAIWGEMSDGDRAAMKAASVKVGATMQGVKGSANVKFWDELTGRGLMRSVNLAEVFGDQAETFAKAGLVAFAVTPKGAETIPGIVAELEKK